ncbi:MAG: hypothetical protein JW891_06440 [Candidatus Lokiarchaeota archaeon]|nr:hypothetical protein [Candidatus Lokiarchaeota archaeon]
MDEYHQKKIILIFSVINLILIVINIVSGFLPHYQEETAELPINVIFIVIGFILLITCSTRLTCIKNKIDTVQSFIIWDIIISVHGGTFFIMETFIHLFNEYNFQGILSYSGFVIGAISMWLVLLTNIITLILYKNLKKIIKNIL